MAEHCGALVWSELDHESRVCTQIEWNDWSVDRRASVKSSPPARGSLNKRLLDLTFESELESVWSTLTDTILILLRTVRENYKVYAILTIM